MVFLAFKFHRACAEGVEELRDGRARANGILMARSDERRVITIILQVSTLLWYNGKLYWNPNRNEENPTFLDYLNKCFSDLDFKKAM